jgi:hypothetical protein
MTTSTSTTTSSSSPSSKSTSTSTLSTTSSNSKPTSISISASSSSKKHQFDSGNNVPNTKKRRSPSPPQIEPLYPMEKKFKVSSDPSKTSTTASKLPNVPTPKSTSLPKSTSIPHSQTSVSNVPLQTKTIPTAMPKHQPHTLPTNPTIISSPSQETSTPTNTIQNNNTLREQLMRLVSEQIQQKCETLVNEMVAKISHSQPSSLDPRASAMAPLIDDLFKTSSHQFSTSSNNDVKSSLHSHQHITLEFFSFDI